MRVGLYQCEIGLPHNAPHLGPALLAGDLQRSGHEVDKALVALSHLDELEARVATGDLDLIGVDAIFPSPAVDRIRRAADGVPVVTGGINALGSFLASQSDYAIVGQARDALPALVQALEGGARTDVPNLFWREESGAIDRSRVDAPADLEREMRDFEPDFDWDYLGPPRAPNANRHRLSVIAELGCPYMPQVDANPQYADVAPASVATHDFTPRAREFVDAHYARDRKGCTFCVFRFQPYTALPTDRTVESLVAQYRALLEREGVHSVWLQSEAPLRFLEPFLLAVDAAGLALTEVTIRAFPAHLLGKRDAFWSALEVAVRREVKVSLTEIGFENHSAAELERFHKGTTPGTNDELDELLGAARKRYGDMFEGQQGHGMILLDPWTTFGDLEANLAAARRMPYLTRGLTADSRLTLYNEYVPIAAKAEQEGLLVRGRGNFGLDFGYRDPRIQEFQGVMTAFERILDDLTPEGERAVAARLLAFERALEIARDGLSDTDKRTRYVSAVREIRVTCGREGDDD